MWAGRHSVLRIGFLRNMSKIFAFVRENIPKFTYILSIYLKLTHLVEGGGGFVGRDLFEYSGFGIFMVMQKYDQFLVSFFHLRGMHHWQPVFRVFSQSVMSLAACLAQAVAIRMPSFANSLLNTPQPASWEPLVIVSMVSRVFREFTVTSHHFFRCALV